MMVGSGMGMEGRGGGVYMCIPAAMDLGKRGLTPGVFSRCNIP